jgi:hypothetical protein
MKISMNRDINGEGMNNDINERRISILMNGNINK